MLAHRLLNVINLFGKALLVFALGNCLVSSSIAQHELRFDTYSIPEGLLSNTAGLVLRDHLGYVWIGTNRGINRFDGTHFKAFQHSDKDSTTLSSNVIWSIIEDRNGDIWIGSREGLNKFNRLSQNFVRYYFPTDSSSQWIRAIHEDDQGQLWIASFGSGLWRFDPQKEEYHPIKSNILNFTSIFQDSKGRMWAGTEDGLLSVDPITQQAIPITHEENNGRIFSIEESHDGNILMASYGDGLIQYDPEEGSFQQITLNSRASSTRKMRKILKDGDCYWIGTDDGLLKLTRDFKLIAHYVKDPNDDQKLQNSIIMSVFKDKDQNLWLGTDAGMAVASHWKNKFHILRPSSHKKLKVKDNNVSALFEDRKGRIWMGTQNDGLILFEGEVAVHYQLDQGLSNHSVLALRESPEGNGLWVGTANGLNFLDYSTGAFKQYFHDATDPNSISHNNLLTIFKDSQDRLWVGSLNGINRYDPENDHFKRYLFIPDDSAYASTHRIYSFQELDQDNFLIGTNNGLFHLNTLEEQETHLSKLFDPAHANGSVLLFGMAPYSDSLMWLADYGIGLRSYHMDQKQFKKVLVPRVNGTINGIVKDDQGHFWISTPMEVLHYDPFTGNQSRFDTYKELGIGSINTRMIHRGAKTGNVYLGGVDGLVYFKPDEVRYQEQQYELSLIAGSYLDPIANQEVALSLLSNSEQISREVIRQGAQLIHFNFGIVNHPRPHSLNYEYQLSGGGSNWISLGNQHQLRYARLPYGDYTLDLRVKDHQDQLIADPVSYKFKILSPLHLRWWAIGIYIIIISAIAFSLYRFYASRKKAEREAARLKEINEVRSSFFSRISHELRNPLSIIKSNAQRLDIDSSLDHRIKSIQREGEGMEKLINQISNLTKLESGQVKVKYIQEDIYSFIAFLMGAFESFAESKGIQLIPPEGNKSFLIDFDQDKLKHILSNYIGNAIRYHNYDHENRWIKMEVEHLAVTQKLKVLVSDNGKGIAAEKLPYIFEPFYRSEEVEFSRQSGTGLGLAICKELAGYMKGTVGVESTSGKGSTFYIELPISNEAAMSSYEQEIEIDKAAVQAAKRPVIPELLDQQSTKKPLILVVEDNPHFRRVVIEALVGHYRIIEAENGAIGVKKAQEELPDLLICDVMMPEMNGYELCTHLKANKRSSHIPIILLSGKTDVASRVKGLKAGAIDYIVKPFEETELLIKVKKSIQLRSEFFAYFLSRQNESPDWINDQIEGEFLEELNSHIDKKIEDTSFRASDLADAINFTSHQLLRKLKAISNKTTAEYLNSYRLNKANILIHTTDHTLSEIAGMVGFKEISYFSRKYKEEFGHSPNKVRSKTE